MAQVRLDGMKTWEETLADELRAPGRVWLLPPEGPQITEPQYDRGGYLPPALVPWTFRPDGPVVTWDPTLEREVAAARTDARRIVHDGILAAHPWLRDPLDEPERPVVLEVTRPAIPLSRVLRVLSELLGFDASRRLVEATFTIGGVILEVYSEGPDGRRFAIGPDREVARDRIVLPIDREL